MTTNWEKFYKDKIGKILTEKKSVLDIGGGLRISKKAGNRYDKNNEWMLPLLEKVSYKILDPVPDYSPDIVGDIHDLPLEDNSQESIVCIAVLEHVENPKKATEEMYRVLKSGGYAFIYVPFLYYYHAERGYYKDYWRFTKDSLEMLFKDFSSVEIQSVRGALETWINMSPLGRIKILIVVFRFLDKILKKDASKQVSGYNVFLVK